VNKRLDGIELNSKFSEIKEEIILRFQSVRIDSGVYRSAIYDLLRCFKADRFTCRNSIYSNSEFFDLIQNKENVIVISDNRRSFAPIYFRLIKAIYDGSSSVKKFDLLELGLDLYRSLLFLMSRDKDFGPYYEQ
ncbi:hypothetical protein PFISCL1PPCAC_18847, partial [Pristionchus fissidentatus]